MFGAFGAWLLQLIGGPLVTGVLGAYKDHLDATNNASSIAANLAVQQATINEQRDALAQQVVIAEQGHWWTSLPRPMIAYSVAIFVFKAMVWDTVFKLGHTDDLTPAMWTVVHIVLTAYFGTQAVERAVTIFNRKK